MTVYPAIAASVLAALPKLTVGGPTWDVTRETGSGVIADPSSASAGTVTAYIVPNAVPDIRQARIGVGIYDSDWLLLARADVVLYAGDVLDDDTLAFRVIGAPDTTLGLLMAPAELTALPGAAAAAGGWSSLLFPVGL